jgi:hypothetical protein
MIHRTRFVAVLGIWGIAVTMFAVPAALPAVGEERGPFAFKAPPVGIVLVYNDGFEVAFGQTKGRVTSALAGPKSAPRASQLEIQDTFMIRRIKRGKRLMTIKNTVDGPGLWPIVLGATRRFRTEISIDGKRRQTQNAVMRIAKAVSTLMLAGKKRRVVEVDLDVRWVSSNGKSGRAGIVYFHDLDLGYYVKRSYTRYGAEGRPRTPVIRELARIKPATKTP